MLSRRRLAGLSGLVFLASVVFLLTASAVNAGHLPPQYGEGDRQFEEIEINEKIVVYFHQRMLGEAMVEKDYIVYQFNKATGELLERKTFWRENLPDTMPELRISGQLAKSMVKGEVQSATLFFISPESDVFHLDTCPRNPCWVVRSVEEGDLVVTIIDAVDGWFLGNGIPPPYSGFSLSGPMYFAPCLYAWEQWSQNAESWFNAMGYSTEHVIWPPQDKLREHIQSWETAVFYEIAHGGSISFAHGCMGVNVAESITAGEIAAFFSAYEKMPFTFIASCEGMCETGSNTMSNAFRKGSMEHTTTVGYCGMATIECEVCWIYSLDWQDDLFYYMSLGYPVKDAFDQANADYPACASASCMRFAGDEDFAIVPVVDRMYCGVNADFTADVTMGCLPLTVYFTDLSIGPVTSRKWYFGDGDSSTALNPSHTYTTTGTFTVTYEVSLDTCTDIETKEDYITIPAGAVCQLEPTTLDFGSVCTGEYRDMSFTIDNPGCDVLNGQISENCYYHSVVSGGGPYSLAVGESLLVTIRFAPATTGTFNCLIETGSGLCADIFCTGIGALPPPTCRIEPDTLDFGSVEVGGFGMLSFDITNVGYGLLSGTLGESCDDYSLASAADYNLTHDQTHTVNIIFFPGSAGTSECIIETGNEDCIDVLCTGVGTVPAVCVVDPDTLDFGIIAVDDSLDQDFIITNTGGDILSGSVSKACVYYKLVAGGGSYDLESGDTLHVTVRYKPAGEGRHECTVETGNGDCGDVYCDGEGSAGIGIDTAVPGMLTLYQNYPNPFNPTTTIAFWLPERGVVNLSIFDVDGRFVKTLVGGVLDKGLKEYPWNGVDSRGNAVSSGVYFYQLKAGGKELTRKMVLLK